MEGETAVGTLTLDQIHRAILSEKTDAIHH
jgi:hypothetical protein